jgi:hypothetical protein
LQEEFKRNILRAENLSLEELDTIFSIISGGDFLGIQVG